VPGGGLKHTGSEPCNHDVHFWFRPLLACPAAHGRGLKRAQRATLRSAAHARNGTGATQAREQNMRLRRLLSPRARRPVRGECQVACSMGCHLGCLDTWVRCLMQSLLPGAIIIAASLFSFLAFTHASRLQSHCIEHVVWHVHGHASRVQYCSEHVVLHVPARPECRMSRTLADCRFHLDSRRCAAGAAIGRVPLAGTHGAVVCNIGLSVGPARREVCLREMWVSVQSRSQIPF
jgi:hypothetical protein